MATFSHSSYPKRPSRGPNFGQTGHIYTSLADFVMQAG